MLPCDFGRLQIPTRASRQIGSRMFFPLWRLVWKASALSGSLIRRPAPNVEDIIVRSAHRCWRAHVVRYCVAAELEEGEATTRWHLVKNPSTSFGTRYEGTKVRRHLRAILSCLALLRRNVVSCDANSSTPMRSPDDAILHLWRWTAC